MQKRHERWLYKVAEYQKATDSSCWAKTCQTSAAKKEDGELIKGPDEMKLRWQSHLCMILNILSEYHEEAINKGLSQPASRIYMDPHC